MRLRWAGPVGEPRTPEPNRRTRRTRRTPEPVRTS